MKEEIKLKKRKPTFDYILNDLAFDSLMFRVVNGIGSNQDKFDFNYQIKLMQKEISRLRKNIYNAIDLMNNTFSINNVKDMFNIMNELENILKGDKDE